MIKDLHGTDLFFQQMDFVWLRTDKASKLKSRAFVSCTKKLQFQIWDVMAFKSTSHWQENVKQSKHLERKVYCYLKLWKKGSNIG